MTPEALLLSALDDLEAKFAATRREFAAAEDAGKTPNELTDWVRSMERPLLNSNRWLADTPPQPTPQPQPTPLPATDQEPTTLIPS